MSRFQNILVVSLVLGFATSAQATTISSTPFSFGYGFAGAGSWGTTETSGANTPTVQGDFSFTPVVTGGAFSGAGPEFPGRVFTNGSGSNDRVGSSTPFSLSIAGAYTGAVPSGVLATEITLTISELRIHGAAHSIYPGTDLTWNETTIGNEQIGPTATLTVISSGAQYEDISNYELLSWDPTDQPISGLTDTRTFNLLSSNFRLIDGLEMFGTVEARFIFPIPEPGTGLLLSLGMVFLARRNSRHRNNS